MAWKYVMIEATFGETKMLFPVIFPDKLVHADVAKHIRACVPLRSVNTKVVSAGKIENVDVTGLGGDSETLGLSSRKEDTRTINVYEYFHGIV